MVTFIGHSQEGKFSLGSEENRMRFSNWLRANPGKELRIEPYEKPKRTNQQLRFYWFYLEIIEQETGNLAADLHEYFKRALLPPKWLKVMSKELKVPGSTRGLSKAEMSEYMDKICALTNVPIPDPTLAGYHVDKPMVRTVPYSENDLGEPLL